MSLVDDLRTLAFEFERDGDLDARETVCKAADTIVNLGHENQKFRTERFLRSESISNSYHKYGGDDPITSDWVASNFPSMGSAYSARQHAKCKQLIWQNRFERFTLYGEPQCHLKTRNDVRRLVAALGCNIPFDCPTDSNTRQYEDEYQQ